MNPASALVSSANRTWTDRNGDFKPDCDLRSPAANGECGALDNRLFGTIVANTTYAEDARQGFEARDYNWRAEASVQQELRPGMALTVGYYRAWYGNFTVTDNLAVTPADFDPFCITAPVDARLPGGGGNQICGLYDISPTKFGVVDNLVTQASNFGKRTEIYNGVDVVLNARFGEGGVFTGGLNTGRTETNCVVVDSPQDARPGFCKVAPPWSAGTQVKFAVNYPLPWNFQVGAVFQNLPGIPIAATYVASNAQIASSLGRNLAAGPNATVVIDLIPPNSQFDDRLTQIDLRFAKVARLGRARVRGMFDIYNVTNSNTALTLITRYGPTWLQPSAFLAARFVKVGVQLEF